MLVYVNRGRQTGLSFVKFNMLCVIMIIRVLKAGIISPAYQSISLKQMLQRDLEENMVLRRTNKIRSAEQMNRMGECTLPFAEAILDRHNLPHTSKFVLHSFIYMSSFMTANI